MCPVKRHTKQDDELTVGFYAPTYCRASTCTTHKLFPEVKYIVRRSQEEEYLACGIENLLVLDDEVISNSTKAHYWPIENADEDIVIVTDDDIEKFVYRIVTAAEMTQQEVRDEVYRIAQILYDLDLGYGGFSQNIAPFNYHDEFLFNKIIGAFCIINRKAFKAEMDLEANWNEDIDRTLQELLLNRVTVMANYICIEHGMDTNSGGDSVHKNTKVLKRVHEYMKSKWGRHYEWLEKTNTIHLHVKR